MSLSFVGFLFLSPSFPFFSFSFGSSLAHVLLPPLNLRGKKETGGKLINFLLNKDGLRD